MTFLNHISVVSGVGVGGGSLTYANTLPVPQKAFFNSGSWAKLADWESELKPHYKEAYSMLGADTNPKLFDADLAIKQLADEIGKSEHFEPTKVGIYFGEPNVEVDDPYFKGKGPSRTGCIHCGACMTGCKHNAKNTLDKNYLHLAQKNGAEILAETQVYDVKPIEVEDGTEGYEIHFKNSIGFFKKKAVVKAKGVVFAAGVLGTIPLLLKLKRKSLSHLSDQVGRQIRTNNEALMIVTSTKKDDKDYSKGLAIGSILHTDEHSHLEPTRYGEGSGFFRILTMPSSHSRFGIRRLFTQLEHLIRKPKMFLRTTFSTKYTTKSTILLFMQTLDSTIRLKLGRITKMKTEKEQGPAPTIFMPEAKKIGEKFGKIVEGIPYANFTDVVFGTATTAHILGGAVMGSDKNEGVIDKDNKIFGYKNMYVCDGSMISANPGVNPSLSITAISELAMSRIPVKK